MRKLQYLPLSFLFLTSLWAAPNSTILQGFYWYIPDAGSSMENQESNLWSLLAGKRGAEIADMGFTHIWLPPMSKAFTPSGDGFNVGYAVYDHYDLGEFHQMGAVRTKYGTKEELHQAVGNLQSRGVKVIADIVMNHLIGAYQAEPVPYSFAFKQHASGVSLKRDGIIDAHVTFDYNIWAEPHSFMGAHDEVRSGLQVNFPLLIDSIQLIQPCLDQPQWVFSVPEAGASWLDMDYLFELRTSGLTNAGALEYREDCGLSTSIVEPSSEEQLFHLFPNPVVDRILNISTQNTFHGPLEVRLYDSMGRFICKWNLDLNMGDSFALDLPEAAHGVMLIELIPGPPSAFPVQPVFHLVVVGSH